MKVCWGNHNWGNHGLKNPGLPRVVLYGNKRYSLKRAFVYFCIYKQNISSDLGLAWKCFAKKEDRGYSSVTAMLLSMALHGQRMGMMPSHLICRRVGNLNTLAIMTSLNVILLLIILMMRSTESTILQYKAVCKVK